MLNKTPESSTIDLDDNDPLLDCVVESQPTAFDNEDLYWMYLDPLSQLEDLRIGLELVPSSPREPSQARNPHFESSHVEDVDDDSKSKHEDSDDFVI